MVKKHLLAGAAAAIVALLIVFVALRFMVSEEARIRRRFSTAASAFNVNGADSGLEALRILRSLRELMADPCLIDLPDVSFSRDYPLRELATYITHFRAQFVRMRISFHNIDVHLIDEKHAECTLTALLSGVTRTNRRVLEAREVKVRLRKVDGRWLFSEIEAVEVLRR